MDLRGQDFQIDLDLLSSSGPAVVEVESDPDFYYILRRSPDLASFDATVTMVLGAAGMTQLIDTNILTLRGFYRVTRVPVDGPLDSDSDGIDDVYELRRDPWLDPLNPGDAPLDYDNDGLSNLEEYRLGSDPGAPDTDGDGWSDGAEIDTGSDPLNPGSFPILMTSSSAAAGHAPVSAFSYQLLLENYADGGLATMHAPVSGFSYHLLLENYADGGLATMHPPVSGFSYQLDPSTVPVQSEPSVSAEVVQE